MRRFVATLVAVALARSAHAQGPDRPRTHPPQPTTADITVADVMTREYIIADDSMQGRGTGKIGGFKSATYIAAELKRLGLEPAGDNGTYFQAIPWVSQQADPQNDLRVDNTPLNSTDYLLLPKIGLAVAIGGQPFGKAFRGENVASVFGGFIDDSTIAPEMVRDKVVVFGAAKDRPAFNFWGRDDLRRYRDAAAILVVSVDIGPVRTQIVQLYRRPRETYDDQTLTGDAAPMCVMSVTSRVAETIFAQPIGALRPGQQGRPVSGSVRFINSSTEAPAYNIVGILRGKDAKLRNTYVSVGAHHDHVGIAARAVDHDSVRVVNAIARTRGGDDRQARQMTPDEWTKARASIDSLHALHGGPRPDSINNGADDDGSGTVLALEIAEAFATAAQRPKRSLLFVFHTAEEMGLYGAQYYSDHPTVPRDSIVGVVNLDQVGRDDGVNTPSGPEALVLIGPKRQSTEFGDLVEKVNSRPEYHFTLDYSFDAPNEPNNGWCRSDHYMYARYGLPVVFFVAAVSYRDLHMVTDEPQYIAYDRMTKIGRYVRDYTGVLANLDHRPVIDKPKPDVNGACRQ